ncbi:hypothetical protein ACVG87_004282 [Klebsiella aerogenes]
MKPVTVETVRARIEQIEHAINTMPGGFTLSINHEFERACLRELLARLEGKGVTVKLPEGNDREDLIMSITEEIAHLKRCVDRFKKEGMASTTQEMEQRLVVQQIALSVLNSATGIITEGAL